MCQVAVVKCRSHWYNCFRVKKVDIKIIFENENYVVCIKPSGIMSEDGDVAGMPTLLSGDSERPYYVIHRLDREVGGVMVYAKDKKTAAALSAQMQGGGFGKEYIAVLSGQVEQNGNLQDFLFRDKRKNKTYIVKRERAGVKKAELEYSLIASGEVDGEILSLVKIHLITGRTHQIRTQFSFRKHPVYGDGKYGSRYRNGFGLFSSVLEFTDPKSGERVSFSAVPQYEEPWAFFKQYL